MKQYRYRPHEIGLKEWPSGELRLNGIEETENPQEADVFVSPIALCNLRNPRDLERFPYIRGRENRHVFFDVSDFETIYTVRDCILIRCNLRPFLKQPHPNSIMWAWPVEDFKECVDVPVNGFSFDVSFQGWLSSDARKAASSACKTHRYIKADVATYNDFTGYIYYTPEGVRRRAEFRRSMRESRIALCPESIRGVLPYRFFEALSAARVPLLVSSGYYLPFEEEIPYDDFIIRCPAEEAHKAGDIVLDAKRRWTDEEFIQRGRECRKWWERYLNREDWPVTMTKAVLKQLEKVAV